MAKDLRPDLVVLDIMLPGFDGLEVCRQMRTFTDCYVIMLTARDDEIDKVDRPVRRGRRLPRQALLATRTDGPGPRHAAPAPHARRSESTRQLRQAVRRAARSTPTPARSGSTTMSWSSPAPSSTCSTP